jgi:hypothetical protein
MYGRPHIVRTIAQHPRQMVIASCKRFSCSTSSGLRTGNQTGRSDGNAPVTSGSWGEFSPGIWWACRAFASAPSPSHAIGALFCDCATVSAQLRSSQTNGRRIIGRTIVPSSRHLETRFCSPLASSFVVKTILNRPRLRDSRKAAGWCVCALSWVAKSQRPARGRHRWPAVSYD